MVDDGWTDRRTDDGPWLYYKLTNEPKGSGELIRYEFHFSDRHQSMNAMGLVQSMWRRHVNFAQVPLRSYVNECQKKEIYFLYLHFVFTLFLFIICELLRQIL